MGKKEDADLFYKRSMGYKHYYCKEFGTLRPILPDGKFYSPFDPVCSEAEHHTLVTSADRV